MVTGESYDRFLAERIFRPLEMQDTFFFAPPDKANRVASVYTYEASGLKRVSMPPPKFPAPEGGLFSTAADMARFHQMMLNKGTLNGRRILSAAAVEAMTTSQTGSMKAGFAPGVGHGFGFEVVRETLGTFRYNSIGSFVKGGAYRTYGWVDPAKDLVGIIFMQRTNGGGDVATRSTALWRWPRRLSKTERRPAPNESLDRAAAGLRHYGSCGGPAARCRRPTCCGKVFTARQSYLQNNPLISFYNFRRQPNSSIKMGQACPIFDARKRSATCNPGRNPSATGMHRPQRRPRLSPPGYRRSMAFGALPSWS